MSRCHLVYLLCAAALFFPCFPGCADLPAPKRPPAAPGAPGREEPRAPTRTADASPERVLQRLVSELDDHDQRRVYLAAIRLMSEAPASRVLPALGERLRANRVEQQMTLLYAIGKFPDEAPAGGITPELVRGVISLLAPFLGRDDQELRREAIEAFAAYDALEPDDTAADPVAQFIARILDAPKERGPSVLERVSAVHVIARKPPKVAVPILMRALESTALADVRNAAKKDLHYVTGRDFRSTADMHAWWQKNRDKTQDQWYRERIERTEAEVAAAREAARGWWRKYTAAIASGEDRERTYVLLKDSLLSGEVPQIRIEAAKAILASGQPTAYDDVVGALTAETDVEVKRAVLLEALARAPPEKRQVSDRIVPKIVELLASPEKDLTTAAATALGDFRAEAAVPRLVELLGARATGDEDLTLAVLLALAKIGPRGDGRVGREISDLLEHELARAPRDLRLIEQAAATLGALVFSDGSAEAERAAALLARLLALTDAEDPLAAARDRQVALISLAALRRRSSLSPVTAALDDADDQVASEAARAIGAIGGGPPASDADRSRSLRALERVLDGPRAALRDPALDSIRAVLSGGSPHWRSFHEVAEKLLASKDYARVIRLLKDIPARPSADEPPDDSALHMELRASLAGAYESAQPPDPKAALEIFAGLAKDAPDRYAERYGAALAALPSEKADDVYEELIRRKPADGPRLWQERIALARRFLDLDRLSPDRDHALAKKARELVERWKAREDLPRELVPALSALEAELAGAARPPEKTGGSSGGSAPRAAPSKAGS